MINSVIAADWYVSPSGQNWYSGNQAQPFETISKAIQEAQSGDTIYVMDGTYRNSNYNLTKIEVENTHYENSSVAPQWLNFGIIGTEIGIGLNIETRITQITEYDLNCHLNME